MLYKWPAWPPGLSTRMLPLHRMSGELCSDEMNVFGRGWARVDPLHMPFLRGGVLGRARVDAELGFIFVLILVRDCIASIYLDDLSGK